MDASRFTVMVLTYGNYPELFARCVDSIMRCGVATIPSFDFRLAINEPGPATAATILRLRKQYPAVAGHLYFSKNNSLKYPMMRRMVYDELLPLREYTMWFDDDSFIRVPDPSWWSRVASAMQQADMVGALYRIGLYSSQEAWVKSQDWYAGKPLLPERRVWFATGGWWTIRSDLLLRHNWPTPELRHRGGDVMLGELCHQQGYRLRNFTDNVAVNADAAGRNSAAKRRGYDEKPIGRT